MLWHRIQWRDCSQTEWIREDNSSSSKAIPHYLVKQLTNVPSTPSITSCCRWCSGAAKGIHSITFWLTSQRSRLIRSSHFRRFLVLYSFWYPLPLPHIQKNSNEFSEAPALSFCTPNLVLLRWNMGNMSCSLFWLNTTWKRPHVMWWHFCSLFLSVISGFECTLMEVCCSELSTLRLCVIGSTPSSFVY